MHVLWGDKGLLTGWKREGDLITNPLSPIRAKTSSFRERRMSLPTVLKTPYLSFILLS